MPSQKQEVIGGKRNFWLYSEEDGYDLTHPATPTSALIYPRISLKTTSARVAIDPAKTALVVVDLQNYFLSPALGRPSDGVGLKVVDKLVQSAIPACRKAGIPIVWLNWGLTQQDIDELPPTIIKGFAADVNFKGPRRVKGLGSPIGSVQLADGSLVDAGRVLMPNQWNTDSDWRLKEKYASEDIVIHKNRLSGLWGGTGMEKALHARGIRTLLFSGANTDQCVSSSFQDAVWKSWDCFLLTDACATTSPMFARKGIEFNIEGGWGFLLSCEELVKAVDGVKTAPPMP